MERCWGYVSLASVLWNAEFVNPRDGKISRSTQLLKNFINILLLEISTSYTHEIKSRLDVHIWSRLDAHT
jgi:hypothetical protein